MANYKVASDRIAGKKAGDSITLEELRGCNVAALLDGGHIVAESTQPKKAEKESN